MDETSAPPDRAGASARRFRPAAPLVVALTLAADLVGLSVHGTDAANWPFFALIGCATLSSSVVGAVIVRARPGNAVGRLLLAHGLLVALVLGPDGRVPWASPTVEAWYAQLTLGAWVLLYVCIALIGYVFPDGRFPSLRWRRFAMGCLVCYGLFLVLAAFDEAEFRDLYPELTPVLPTAPSAVQAVAFACWAGVAASLVGAVVCARSRLRRADGEERVQLLWFVWAALAIPAGLGVCLLDNWITGGAGLLTLAGVTVASSVFPLAIGAAVLRRRLFDIELVLSRTLTYGALTVLVVAVYAGVLQGLGSLIGDRGAAGLLAVGVVAVAIQPAHAAARRRAERWVYGDRSDPYGALRRLAGRLEGAVGPAEAVGTVTASVAEALRIPPSAVALVRQDTTPEGEAVALSYQGGALGWLAVTPPPGRALTAADRRLLGDLARQAAVVVNAVQLTLDLQESRARLVTAREEERRRLRRDLHDGLGPSLAAIVLKLTATAALVREPEAGRLLGELREETRAAIAEIRRLVDDLRPPALDEVGLVAAVRQLAQRLCRETGALTVTVEGPAAPPPLPAAVEVAAYRIAAEALTNVVRHSGARRCAVTLVMNGGLELTVADNGGRSTPPSRTGVGSESMRERAAELGGSCTIAHRPEGGTVVRAVLPLQPRRAARAAEAGTP
ncbi:sensor histidine kinase [Streptomyces sp. NPDC051940]|uniref:sensor histidine kinase n=1 Tax=Streptomyces sp. NPDC051940 TaxID=3155675 RepID=UPI0034219FB7